VPHRPPRAPRCCRRGLRPFSRGPPSSSARAPPLLPWTAAAPSSVGAPPTDDLLPERRRHFRLQLRRPRLPPTPHLLPARHTWRPGMGPAAQRRPPRLGWFFFKMQLHVYNF
jgi:hypothetical protein